MKTSDTATFLLSLLPQISRRTPQSSSSSTELQNCGAARYYPTEYTCYDGSFLCPVLDGQPTERCGDACYSPESYACQNGELVFANATCSDMPRTLHLSDGAYDNFFYSDCHSATQVVVTSPLPDSNLTIIGPRLIVAWPAGNSGIAAFFSPANGINGTLGISMTNSTDGSPLGPVYQSNGFNTTPIAGIEGVLDFNSSAVLSLAILGSIRTIRDFTEGPSLLQPIIQNANMYSVMDDGSGVVSRMWLDNTTMTSLMFMPLDGGNITVGNRSLSFAAGQYGFSASFNYTQLEQLSPSQVLSPQAHDLITNEIEDTTALSFFSYTNKLLAGGWRFLTYFGRDTMITALLMDSVLSQGNASAIEAVIGSVLERMNRTDGSACHEETIGDYATFLNYNDNITTSVNHTSTAPQYDYKMVDTDLYLPVLMKRYFVDSDIGKSRSQTFLSQAAGKVNPKNLNLTWANLAQLNAERIMNLTTPFVTNMTQENLVHLKDGQIVGQWRDSTYGIGGGRIPYDINTALIPAALRAIAALSNATNGSFYPDYPQWSSEADKKAQVWEDSTLQFFQITVPQAEAASRVESFANSSSFYSGPSNAGNITSDYVFHAISLDGYNNFSMVEIVNTDDCFRHYLLNTTNQTQLTSFVNQTANHILLPFPAGLTTDLGMVVANPALASAEEASVLHANFTNSAYHGTVIWSWQLAMMAKGLEYQIGRCSADKPDFCSDSVVLGNVKAAYNKLWDGIEKNKQYVLSEVWSWSYANGKYEFADLGTLPPPPGVGGSTESDVRQLWSLSFLAIQRDSNIK
ncbi:hypothetical protein ANO11243_081170 [Dothideomycetidae sp. 11243]|nr:hypothetical protein ANO11243_081170 [fungal sp. No.11243]